MRLMRLALLLVVPALAGCGDDPFAVEDALGLWEAREINGLTLSGTSPVGVWIREPGGDSTSVVIESITLQFQAAAVCVWTLDDGIQGADTDDDCTYDVATDGDITVTVSGTVLQGTAEGTMMTLRDQATNELLLEKRP